MLVFPNIKLNLGLRVTARRADGYHDLETCFLPVPGCGDALEATVSPDGETRLFLSGIQIPGEADDNLVMRAYRLLDARYGLPPLHIFLHKAIPAGAGVGAGSADAAFALKLFAELDGHDVPVEELEALALELGSDCPVFIKNVPAIGRGRGERLTPLELPLKGCGVRVFFPGIHVSTREAFAGIVLQQSALPLEACLARPVVDWQGMLVNDFEAGVFARHPVLRTLKDTLLSNGAFYAAMSGSGSAVFGLFAAEVARGWEAGFSTYASVEGGIRYWQGTINL